MTPSERDNTIIWDRRRTGHYEVWYLTLSDLATGAAFWIRYTLEAPQEGRGAPHARLWFSSFSPDGKGGEAARHLDVSIDRLEAGSDPFSVRMGDSELTHGTATGAIPGHAAWDLRWSPPIVGHHHLPGVAYHVPIASTTVLSPAPAVRFSGTITAGDRTFELDGAPGCQTHLWGKKHAEQWVWARASSWDGGEDAFFEGLTARVRRGRLLLPPMTVLSLRLAGKVHHVKALRQALRTKSAWSLGRWSFSGEGPTLAISGEVTHPAADLLLAEYTDPDGEESFCHNSELASVRLRTWLRDRSLSRWRPGPELSASGMCHAEWGDRTASPLIRRRILPA